MKCYACNVEEKWHPYGFCPKYAIPILILAWSTVFWASFKMWKWFIHWVK